MYKIPLILIILASFSSCKNEPSQVLETTSEEIIDSAQSEREAEYLDISD